jgi:uncharacterized RDD family membrane protein YckC
MFRNLTRFSWQLKKLSPILLSSSFGFQIQDKKKLKKQVENLTVSVQIPRQKSFFSRVYSNFLDGIIGSFISLSIVIPFWLLIQFSMISRIKNPSLRENVRVRFQNLEIIGPILFFSYNFLTSILLFFKDAGNYSFGRHVTKSKVVKRDGSKPNKADLLKRNYLDFLSFFNIILDNILTIPTLKFISTVLMFCVPVMHIVDAVLVFKEGRKSGDYFADTIVVEDESMENENF